MNLLDKARTEDDPYPEDSHLTIWIDPERCQGCVLCLKSCPTKAIRVRRGVAAILAEHCINCGNCFRVCPHRAVHCRTTPLRELLRYPRRVAAASPALYSQFGYNVTPNQVLTALKRIGFEEVVDLGWLCEMNSMAVEEYLLAHPQVRPGISPVCPAVVRLIAKRFPSLLPNIVPVLPPRLFGAKGIKSWLVSRKGWASQDIGVFHIAPCAAKMSGAENRVMLDDAYVDGVVSFRDIYGPVLHALKHLKEDSTLQKCSGAGIGWAMSGGQAQGVDVEHTLAVAGFQEVVTILEMVEAGRLDELRFVEALICPDGCLGGPLAVENRYRAKSVTQRLLRRYGALSRVKRGKVLSMIEEGLFDWESAPRSQPLPPLDQDKAKAIEKMKAIQALKAALPHGECGACGSPDCHSFAVDVVLGHAQESDCPVMSQRGNRACAARDKEESVTVQDVVARLGLQVAAGAKGLDRQVDGGYVSDMLSDVMANAGAGALWLTVQVHQNVVAVAVLKELAAIILVGGRQPAEDTKEKADQEGVPLLVASDQAFVLAGKLHDLGL